jgi:integral membrane protein
MTSVPATPKATRILWRYRVMAFATGSVLVLACIALFLQKVAHVHHLDLANAILWITHGYCFLVYCMATVHLGITMRWSLVRLFLVGAAGTIPTMSFVAEHYVTRDVRFAWAANAPTAGVPGVV